MTDDEILTVYDRIKRMRAAADLVDHAGTVTMLIGLGAQEGEDMRFQKVCKCRVASLVKP